MTDFENARTDLQKAVELTGGDSAIKKEIDLLEKQEAEQKYGIIFFLPDVNEMDCRTAWLGVHPPSVHCHEGYFNSTFLCFVQNLLVYLSLSTPLFLVHRKKDKKMYAKMFGA